ncbi:ABC transporter permease subunit [Aureimonas frigidaquae]|uniref:ABC transmembrane type-1 domain-containing protein n=1 Tax=Aureimonas frigidaquae TaxID=424757 RepID=A0A0P0Z392_9HYPH|nr:hypothetical protein [Aureimonas frigidaquae]
MTNGQGQAARALDIPAWKAVWYIVLPQAIQKVIPPLTNTGIGIVMNTSLASIVVVSDMLSAGCGAATDPAWPAPYTETYLFVAGVYVVICYGVSRHSLWRETRLRERERR